MSIFVVSTKRRRAQLIVRKPFAIGPKRRVVVHAGGEIAPMRRRQRLPRCGFEFQNIDGLRWIGDDELFCGLPQQTGHRAEERTARKEFEKCAAAVHIGGVESETGTKRAGPLSPNSRFSTE